MDFAPPLDYVEPEPQPKAPTVVPPAGVGAAKPPPAPAPEPEPPKFTPFVGTAKRLVRFVQALRVLLRTQLMTRAPTSGREDGCSHPHPCPCRCRRRRLRGWFRRTVAPLAGRVPACGAECAGEACVWWPQARRRERPCSCPSSGCAPCPTTGRGQTQVHGLLGEGAHAEVRGTGASSRHTPDATQETLCPRCNTRQSAHSSSSLRSKRGLRSSARCRLSACAAGDTSSRPRLPSATGSSARPCTRCVSPVATSLPYPPRPTS